MDIEAAVRYPYRKENVIQTVVIPGSVQLANIVLSIFIFGLVYGLMLLSGMSQEQTEKASDVVSRVIDFPFSLILGVLLLGYNWAFFARLQEQGYAAQAPSWQNFGTYIKPGFKLSVFYFLLMLVVMVILVPLVLVVVLPPFGDEVRLILGLGMLALGVMFWLALAPFFSAPMIHSAQTRSFRDLWNFKKAVAITLPRYFQVWQAFLVSFVLYFVYIIVSVMVVLFTCCVGSILLPYLWLGYSVSSWHLIAQAFDYHPDSLQD